MTPLTPTDIEHIADVIADTFPLCASQLREHAGTMRSVSEVTEHRMADQCFDACTCHAWQPISSAPEGVPVETKIHDGQGARNQQVMVRRGRLWFTGGMYVYYEPTHWRVP